MKHPRHSESGVFIALGSNLGDRERHIRNALHELAATARIRVLRNSTILETTAVGGPPQGDYLNAVAELSADLPPRELLDRMLEIECAHGRERRERWGPRTLDLDLLLFCEQIIHQSGLIIPHPRMWERDFVIRPLREICGDDRFESLRRFGQSARQPDVQTPAR